MMKQYKFLRKGMKSENGEQTWRLNKWYKIEGKLELCRWGFHSSKEPYDAFSYVQGEILAVVECRGEHLKDENKYCWREQRVVKTYKWTKKDSLRLAIFSAEQVIDIFEKYDKDDKRPREAIETAKRYLEHPTAKNKDAAAYAADAADAAAAADAAYAAAAAAAYAADAAYAAAAADAYAAAAAAAYAADAADAAAYAADAADAAAYAADAAYAAAAAAADAAAYADMIKKIQRYFKKVVKEKENE